MSKLSLKMKLGLGFGALLLIMVVIGGIGYQSAMKMSDANARAINDLTKSKLAGQMTTATEKQTTGVRGFLLAGKEDLLKHDQEGQTEFKEAGDQLEKLLDTEEGKRLYAEIRRTAQQFRTIADKEIALKRAGKAKEAEEVAFSSETSQVRNELRNALSQLDEFYDKQSHAAVEEGAQIESRTRGLIIGCVVAGIILGVVIAGLIVRSVRSTLLSMGELIGEIAGNNLAVADMKITTEDEIGRAGTALNSMKNSLREMIQSIAGTAEHVASASEEISSSATQQAQGAETQKDQTAQVATAMQEMPRSCAEAGVLRRVVPLMEIPAVILQATRYRKRA
jgi:methyl-accepting chemotaxis protein